MQHHEPSYYCQASQERGKASASSHIRHRSWATTPLSRGRQKNVYSTTHKRTPRAFAESIPPDKKARSCMKRASWRLDRLLIPAVGSSLVTQIAAKHHIKARTRPRSSSSWETRFGGLPLNSSKVGIVKEHKADRCLPQRQPVLVQRGTAYRWTRAQL